MDGVDDIIWSVAQEALVCGGVRRRVELVLPRFARWCVGRVRRGGRRTWFLSHREGRLVRQSRELQWGVKLALHLV
jgi:hypothetical protein